jgi:hypothetical protein
LLLERDMTEKEEKEITWAVELLAGKAKKREKRRT